MRNGDIDGDGIDDILVGADQEEESGSNSGAGYAIRGGAHFAVSGIIDLAATQGTALEGNVTRLLPPPGSGNFHLGATCFVADLDGNDRAEVMLAAALSRSGASIRPHNAAGATWQANGGAPGGRLYIAWDDNFSEAPWPAELQFGDLPGSETVISGGGRNRIFGEEIIGGADFNGNGQADLFVGDFVADVSGLSLALSGAGYILYEAASLKGESFVIDDPPVGTTVSIIAGPSRNAIGADTAAAADFDADGFDDLAFGSPHHPTQGRISNGAIHVFFGQAGTWPAFMSTVPGHIPSPALVRVTEVQGALGHADGGDRGDTLSYSASSGDVDGDGFADLLSNEMLGNGLAPNTLDVGNLIIVSGRDLAKRSRLNFAQVGNGDDFSFLLELLNPHPGLMLTANARFRDDDGNPLLLPLRIDGVAPAGIQNVSEIELEIPPLGTVSVRSDGTGELVTGTGQVSSNGALGGLVFFNFPGIGIAAIPASPPLSNFVTSVRRQALDEIRTGIAISNLGNEEAVLNPVLNDADGLRLAEGNPIVLPAGGHMARFVDELFGDAFGSDMVGTLIVTCDSCTLAAVAMTLGSAPGNFTAVPVVELPTP